MADEEEFGELAEINLSQYGGRWGSSGGSWGRSPGGGSVSVISSPHHHNSTARFSSQPPHQPSHRAGSYEAEDVMYPRGAGSSSRGRSGLYYSPPGTSYTIVERPTTAPTPGKHPRGTYLGSSTTFNNSRPNHHHHHHHHHAGGSNGKKRPISPEQVLRLFGTGGGAGNKMTPSVGGGRRSAVSSPASSPHNLNMHQDLVVRTVNMVRPPESSHGFGICVKGGKDSGECPCPCLSRPRPCFSEFC
ncbi:uncharacterized protein [Periplaneta americana]|uniref:uncharacterized protein n=1 Tax=Periplaneta americana TaxID=6978 RepID=UPI0037E75C22